MSFLRSKLTLVAASGFILMFGILISRAYMQERVMRGNIAKLEVDIASAERKNRELERLAEYFSKPEHLEKEAKIRLNLKRPDEEVMVLSPETIPAQSATDAPRMAAGRTSVFPITNIADFFRSLFTYSIK